MDRANFWNPPYCLNETKLDPECPKDLTMVTGYRQERRERTSGAGGIFIYVRDSIKYTRRYDLPGNQLEGPFPLHSDFGAHIRIYFSVLGCKRSEITSECSYPNLTLSEVLIFIRIRIPNKVPYERSQSRKCIR